MKKRCVFSLIVALTMTLAACSGGASLEKKEGQDGKKTVVLSVLHADPVYSLAEKQYEEKHPNVDIQIKEYSKGEGSNQEGDIEKYVNTTNTELLSGKGADLISLNVKDLPVRKYVDKKMLVNLSSLMKKDATFDSSQYEMNILDGAKINGGLYTMPLRFSLNGFMGDAKAIEESGVKFDDSKWTWSEFITVGKSLAASGGHTYSIGNTSRDQMLYDLFTDNYKRIVNEETRPASFNTNEFALLMEQVKTLFEEKVVTDAEVDAGDYFFSTVWIFSPTDYFVMPSLIFEKGKGKIYNKPLATDQQVGDSFTMQMTLGMNATSAVQAEAWDFMKFLMSEEIQTMPDHPSFSIHKAVNEKTLQDLQNKGSIEAMGSTVPVQKADIDMIKQMMVNASTPEKHDSKIRTIITEEVKAYYSGQKSAQAVAELVANRVTTYLNE
ncbi:multiple sugar transport system substrate-binding protein [Paenibacillus anaericanus]|uniref:ABC transporter substrate-binding protein n=1 Tax=Paenibacillus anaericanus TaxID=170367 RepID=UPI00278AAF85|nr:ABC transporter substrate-binding protein [Paenibacillus anaericanus]MDQ0088946.1 multiple sugar transport system substrate-binding protein [Paenibacillus anaericanus]